MPGSVHGACCPRRRLGRRRRHPVAHGEGRRARATADAGSRGGGARGAPDHGVPVRSRAARPARSRLPHPRGAATAGRVVDAHAGRRGRGLHRVGHGRGCGVCGCTTGDPGRTVLRSHRRRARLPGGPGHRGSTAGRARRDHAARRRAGGRGAARVRTSRSHARRSPGRGRRGRADRRRRRTAADRARGAAADRADARRILPERRRRHDAAGTLVSGAQAGRDPDPGAQTGPRGAGLHAFSRRHHRPAARGRRGGRGAPRRDAGARRRGDRAAPRRPARTVPGHWRPHGVHTGPGAAPRSDPADHVRVRRPPPRREIAARRAADRATRDPRVVQPTRSSLAQSARSSSDSFSPRTASHRSSPTTPAPPSGSSRTRSPRATKVW